MVCTSLQIYTGQAQKNGVNAIKCLSVACGNFVEKNKVMEDIHSKGKLQHFKL